MEASIVLELRPHLRAFTKSFDGCLGNRKNREHLRTYIEGQVGPLERKSVEPIALAAGVPPRTLQEFLCRYKWDADDVRNTFQRRIAALHFCEGAIAVLDDTTFIKKGTHTACVQRQHCGRLGKTENCVTSVHLGYATPTFYSQIDAELFLPEESWGANPERCARAGIPPGVVYRSKCHIALDMLARARANGVHTPWVTFDEWYGGKPWFLRELDTRGYKYVAEVPTSFMVWTKEPKLRRKAHPSDQSDRTCTDAQGEPVAKEAALMAQTNPMISVKSAFDFSPKVRDLKWEQYVVNESTKGPLVWEAIRVPVWLKDEKDLPTRTHTLIIAKSLLHKAEIKYFLSNAPEATKMEELLFVAFSRWRIERTFEDAKTDLGMADFEMRKYEGIRRHLIISCLSHGFLAEEKEKTRPKSPGAHGEPTPRRDLETCSAVDIG